MEELFQLEELDTIEEVFFDLREDVLRELHVQTHHFLDLLTPLVDHLVHKKGWVEHGGVVSREHRIL